MTVASLSVKPAETGSERPASAAPADNPNKIASATPERPAWLPAKFASVEQLGEAYTNLEAEFSRSKQPPTAEAKPAIEDKPAAKPDGEKPAAKPSDLAAKLDGETEDKPGDNTEDKPKSEEDVANVLKSKGIDVDAVSAKFWETGEIDEKAREAIVPELKKLFGEERGEAMLDEFAESKRLAQEYTEFRLYEPFGGKDQGEKAIQWAQKNLSTDQRKAIKTLWESPKLASQVEGSKLLLQYFEKAEGKQPTVVIDGDSPSVDGVQYKSWAEVRVDMGDPRYQKDPAFRADVAAKLARSNIG